MPETPKKPNLCMFCGGDESLGPMNIEHFVMKCLWDGNRPPHTLTLPAHVSCNASFSDDNDYFRTTLAAQARAENHPEAIRVLDGPIKRMADRRPGQFARYIQDYARRPVYGPGGIYLGDQPSFMVDYKRVNRVLRNVVKGIYYWAYGEPLLTATSIDIEMVRGKPRPEMQYFIDRMGGWMTFGDSVFGCRVVLSDVPQHMACLMCFYKFKVFFAIASDGSKPLDESQAQLVTA